MVSVAEQLRPTHSEPMDVAGDERALGKVADILGGKWTLPIPDAMDRGVDARGR